MKMLSHNSHWRGSAAVLAAVLATSTTGLGLQSLQRDWMVGAHVGPLTSIDCSDSATSFLSTSTDGSARIWNAASPSQIVLPCGDSPIEVGDLRFDGTKAAYADRAGNLYIYTPATSSLITLTDLDEGVVRDLRFSSDGSVLISAGSDGMSIRSGTTGQLINAALDGAVVAVDEGLSPLAVSLTESQIDCWDTGSGTSLFAVGVPDGATDVAISRQLVNFGSLCGVSGLTVWDLASQQTLIRVPDPDEMYTCLELVQDGSIAILGDRRGYLTFIDTVTGAMLSSFPAHLQGLTDIRMVGDLPFFLTCADDGLSGAWDLQGNLLGPISKISGDHWKAGVSDSGAIVTAGTWARAEHRSALDGQVIQSLHSQDQSGTQWEAVDFSIIDRGTLIAVDIANNDSGIAGGAMDGHLKVWDLPTGTLQHDLALSPDLVTAVQYSPNGARIYAANAQGLLHAIDSGAGTGVWSVQLDSDVFISTIAVSDNGSLIAATDGDGQIFIVDAASGQATESIEATKRSITALLVTPTNGAVVFADRDGSVSRWQLGTTVVEILHQFPDASASGIALVPGTARIIAASHSGTVVRIDLGSLLVDSVSVDWPVTEVYDLEFVNGSVLLFGRLGAVSSFTPSNL